METAEQRYRPMTQFIYIGAGTLKHVVLWAERRTAGSSHVGMLQAVQLGVLRCEDSSVYYVSLYRKRRRWLRPWCADV